MLDHKYYPHIIDLLFVYAPPESLFVMSRVSGGWRKAAHRQLGHVRDFSTSRTKSTFHIQFSVGRVWRITPTGTNTPISDAAVPHFKWKSDAEKQTLPWVKVLDISGSAALCTISMPEVDTIRFLALPKEEEMYIPPSVRRVIIPNLYSFHFLRRSEVKRIIYVQNIHFPGNGWDLVSSAATPPCFLREIVYVYQGVSESDDPLGWEPYAEGFLKVLRASKRWQVNLIAVNVPAAIIDYAASSWDDVSWFEGVVTLNSLEEYRKSIGDEEFAIETDLPSSRG